MIPCIVPARAGSKGLTDKNLCLLGDRPLVAWPIEAALKANLVDQVICSTDSPRIAEAARLAGARCGRLRPAELSGDSAMVIDTLRYELDRLRSRNEEPQHLCVVQATSPFVNPLLIDRAIALASTGQFDVVCTGRRVEADHPEAMFELGAGSRVRWATGGNNRSRRRQDGRRLWVRSGLVYVFRTDHLDSCGDDYFDGSIGCVPVEGLRAQSIDTQLDLDWCRFLLQTRNGELMQEERV